jgi:hypothetical protein
VKEGPVVDPRMSCHGDRRSWTHLDAIVGCFHFFLCVLLMCDVFVLLTNIKIYNILTYIMYIKIIYIYKYIIYRPVYRLYKNRFINY